MTSEELAGVYRGYIACLNRQDWPRLGEFVAETVEYNGARIGLAGYRDMLERDFEAIPDLAFKIALLACDPPQIASRLDFDCTPVGTLFDLPVNGRRVRFAENVFYRVRDGRIAEVWSVIDKGAIAAQLRGAGDAPGGA
ncbi:ester cyclase [Salipiger mangrovisoli]|uniref:Ester cyclase n=1 Tax=Salipiger mangrovisoli TaxID=2865933 RepID=A0ABR9X8G2_9RHOB|nr:ester cyclase [Salipiger mangrovisoli]MBE9639895.1 ester cyclase [Salipiger mangrovisoli]